MSKKTSFHKFNQQIDREPTEVSTDVQVSTPKLEKLAFNPEVRIDENMTDVKISPDTSSLKELFGELDSLLSKEQVIAEEPVNTNPYPSGPLPSEREAQPANPTPPLPVPVDAVIAPIAGDSVATDDEKERSPKTQKVEEARLSDFHAVADEIDRSVSTPVTPPPQVIVQTPTPVRTGWVFTVHRNSRTNLIERIEADPKPLQQ